MKHCKPLLLSALLACLAAFSLCGCVYAYNKSWDDMTPAEQQQVQQALDEVHQALDEVHQALDDAFED